MMTYPILILSLILVLPFKSIANPPCYDGRTRMEYNNGMVLSMRELMENKFTARAFVQGTLVHLIEDRQNHAHFEVDLDRNLNTQDDRIEVVYNTKYGPVPPFKKGDNIIACGDLVVDNYSPHGAVVHWLHVNPKLRGPHEDGYLMINGQITGLSLK